MLIEELGAEISCLKLADGSCEWRERGRTIAICGINGPGDVPSSRRLLDRTSLSFTFSGVESEKDGKSARGLLLPSSSLSASQPASPSRSSFIESVIGNVIDLEAYPRTGLQVCVQQLHRAESVSTTAATLNCIYLALLDAGIKLHYSVAAVSAVLFSDSSLSLILPSADSQNLDDRNASVVATFTFVFKMSPAAMGDGGGLSPIAGEAAGKFHLVDYFNALEATRSVSPTIFNLYRRVIGEKFIHRLPSSGRELTA